MAEATALLLYPERIAMALMVFVADNVTAPEYNVLVASGVLPSSV